MVELQGTLVWAKIQKALCLQIILCRFWIEANTCNFVSFFLYQQNHPYTNGTFAISLFLPLCLLP